jgi:methylmalonyl-CoA mutase N-terminal domain/subunit
MLDMARVREVFEASEDFTVGLEEEFAILEPETLSLDHRFEELRDVARGDGNLLYPIREALRAGGSIGEVCGAMRDVFGEYRGGAFF